MTENNGNRFLEEGEARPAQKPSIISNKKGTSKISRKVTCIVAQIFGNKKTEGILDSFVMPEDGIFGYGGEFDNIQDGSSDEFLIAEHLGDREFIPNSNSNPKKGQKGVFLSEEELASLLEIGQEESKILKTLIIEEISESLLNNPEVVYKSLFLAEKYSEAIKLCVIMVAKITKEIEIIEGMNSQSNKYIKLIKALNDIKKTWKNKGEATMTLSKRKKEDIILKN